MSLTANRFIGCSTRC